MKTAGCPCRVLILSSETISWDVRTKHVTYDTIPTLENIRGLALYGPGASLFTLGANNTVQQFDLNAPAMLVANVQHPANLLPPSPPISLEAEDKTGASQSESESSVPIAIHADVSEDDHMSPLARLVKSEHSGSDADNRYGAASPVSSRSRSSVSISSASSHNPTRAYPSSTVSRGMTENTYISAGSSMRSATTPLRDRGDRSAQRESFSTSSSVTSSHYRSRHRPSRLRHEVPRSPEDSKVIDLFKFTKSRLVDVPFKPVFQGDTSRLTNDDLRRQMLSTIFGWNKEADDLVRDEMSRHPLGSTSRILLAKWLGDINTDIMAMGSENMTSSDWMILALSGIGGQASQHKLGRAYVQRLLESGDVHAAVTIMIGLGDYNDAIEIYISHKRQMEALILTCLFFPGVWERQEAILRKWGEWAVQHGQQQLAIRCFSCTGRESTEPWTSPSANQVTFQSMHQAHAKVGGDALSPPMSPPSVSHGPQRSVAKASALKLITSFGDPKARSKFFGGADEARTPIVTGATPIDNSAVSSAQEPATAVLRGGRSALQTPASARPVFSRGRLPSIGEAPDSGYRELLTAVTRSNRDPYADLAKPTQAAVDAQRSGLSLEMLRPHTSSPRLIKDKHAPLSPSPAAVAVLMESSARGRNGSRTRIPEGLDLSLPRFNDPNAGDMTPSEPSAASSTRYHWPTRRRHQGPGSVASSVTSASAASSITGKISSQHHSSRHHYNQGKSLDDYLHSVEGGGKGKHRASSREGRSRARESSRDARRAESRGYTPKGGKRSPKSPVPMSPEDLINLSTPEDGHQNVMDERGQLIDISMLEPELPPTVRKITAHRDASAVRGVRTRDGSLASRRAGSRDGRRASSPDKRSEPAPLNLRGRSSTRDTSHNRSPSSPLPMSAAPQFYGDSNDEDDYKKALEEKERFRNRKGGRSSSRNGKADNIMSPMSSRSTTNPWGGRETSQQPLIKKMTLAVATPAPMQLVPNPAGLPVSRDERQLKKEAAARELEERRRSLALRPTAPAIPHPDQFQARTPPSNYDIPQRGTPPSMHFDMIRNSDVPQRCASAEPGTYARSMYANRESGGMRVGLPATPKAMRLVLELDTSRHPMPALPPQYAQQSPPITQTSPARTSPQPSPKSEAPPPTLLLPSTVYTPPPSRQAAHAAQIQRSMSAPPRDLPPPSSTPAGFRPVHQQKSSLGGRRPSHDAAIPIPPPPPGRRPSYDSIPVPPPPPPAPPVLKELQHLALPPPPPPAPLPHALGTPKPVVYGGSASGMIEIVMDGDEDKDQLPEPIIANNLAAMVAPPIPTSSRNSHHRGRSSIDNSIGARITRAAERVRSVSRSGRPRGDVVSRVKSPDSSEMMHGSGGPSPYESIPMPMPSLPALSYQMRAEMAKSPVHQQVGQVGQGQSPQGQQQQQQQSVQILQTADGKVIQRDDFRTGLERNEFF